MAGTSSEQLRDALTRYRQRVRHGRFPDDLRRRASAYVRERLCAGAAFAAIATELGVAEATSRAWAEEEPTSAARVRASTAGVAMVPLLVRPGPETAAIARLEVSFPDGTKVQVSGMTGREVTDTITALRGSR